MILFPLIFGLLLPTLSGYLLLLLAEGNMRVLYRIERTALGLLLGLVLMMFLSFLCNVWLHVPFTLMGFFSVQACVTLLISGVFLWQHKNWREALSPRMPLMRLSPVMMIVCVLLGVWTLVKIMAGGFMLAEDPAFFDDTVNNWNMRAKIFYVDKTFTIDTGPDRPLSSGILSYPPTIPLAKTWLATIANQWSEGLVNSLHLVWFAAALILLFSTLLRRSSLFFALLGTYVLTSLPLYLIQGTSAYADVFVSAHVFAVLAMLLHAAMERSTSARLVFLRIAGLMTGVLTFTKNESLILYLPLILGLFALVLVQQWRSKRMTQADLLRAAAWWMIPLLVIAVPWVGFKLSHGLVFGNAKDIGGVHYGWQAGVLKSAVINMFFEGNWLLLFPLTIGLLIWRWKAAFRSPLVLLTAFALAALFSQLFLYLFTSLSAEALFQTGFARGDIHIMPILVCLTVLLMADLVTEKDDAQSEEGMYTAS